MRGHTSGPSDHIGIGIEPQDSDNEHWHHEQNDANWSEDDRDEAVVVASIQLSKRSKQHFKDWKEEQRRGETHNESEQSEEGEQRRACSGGQLSQHVEQEEELQYGKGEASVEDGLVCGVASENIGESLDGRSIPAHGWFDAERMHLKHFDGSCKDMQLIDESVISRDEKRKVEDRGGDVSDRDPH